MVLLTPLPMFKWIKQSISVCRKPGGQSFLWNYLVLWKSQTRGCIAESKEGSMEFRASAFHINSQKPNEICGQQGTLRPKAAH